MRPRWRSSGDGTADLHPQGRSGTEDGGSRACCLARNARERRGRRSAEPLRGQGRPGARPATQRGRLGSLGTVARRERRRSYPPAAEHARAMRYTPPQSEREDHEPVPTAPTSKSKLNDGKGWRGASRVALIHPGASGPTDAADPCQSNADDRRASPHFIVGGVRRGRQVGLNQRGESVVCLDIEAVRRVSRSGRIAEFEPKRAGVSDSN